MKKIISSKIQQKQDILAAFYALEEKIEDKSLENLFTMLVMTLICLLP